jgi:hypothetical protein
VGCTWALAETIRLFARLSLRRYPTSIGRQRAPRYERRFLAGWLLGLPAQKSRTWRVAAVWVAVRCFLAALVACPRALPAALLAAVSHMLMNGFFFNQGLLMLIQSRGEPLNMEHEWARHPTV